MSKFNFFYGLLIAIQLIIFVIDIISLTKNTDNSGNNFNKIFSRIIYYPFISIFIYYIYVCFINKKEITLNILLLIIITITYCIYFNLYNIEVNIKNSWLGFFYLLNFIFLFCYFIGIKFTKLNNLTIIDNIKSISTQVETSQSVNNSGIELNPSGNPASANPDSTNPVSGGFKKRNRKYNKNSFKVLKDDFLSLF